MNAANITFENTTTAPITVVHHKNDKAVVLGIVFIVCAMFAVALFAIFVKFCCKKMTLLHLCWFKCCKKNYTYEELSELKQVVYETQ